MFFFFLPVVVLVVKLLFFPKWSVLSLSCLLFDDNMYVSYAERAAGVSIEPGPFSFFFRRSGRGKGGSSHVSPRAPISHSTYRLANTRETL